MSHCRALDCDKHAKPGQLMCREHWFALPKHLRDAIWSTWRGSQAGDMKQLVAYRDNVAAAVALIAEKEGKQPRLPLGGA